MYNIPRQKGSVYMKKRDAFKILGIDNSVDNIKLNNIYKKELLENKPYENYSFENDQELYKQLNNNFSILKTLELKDIDKKNLLHQLNILINTINIKKEYLYDKLIGETYNCFFEEEAKLLKDTYELIIECGCNNLNNIIENKILEHNKLIFNFILKLFKKLYNKYHLSTNSYWLKHECRNYIENSASLNLNTINASCKYFFELRKSIFKKIIETDVDSLLTNVSDDKKEKLKEEIMKKLLSNFDYNQLFDNYEIIINTVDEYVKEKTATRFIDKLIVKVKKKTKKLLNNISMY